ncbi:MAG: hypothetical protein EOP49_32090, partial [Sphingobacteriales bacterium]
MSILAVSAIVTGCKITRPVVPDSISTPTTFRANDTTVNTGTDTASIAKIKWSEYFSDQKLSRLIDEAIRQNPDLLMAVQRIQKANSILMVSRNAFFPSVNGVAAA